MLLAAQSSRQAKTGAWKSSSAIRRATNPVVRHGAVDLTRKSKDNQCDSKEVCMRRCSLTHSRRSHICQTRVLTSCGPERLLTRRGFHSALPDPRLLADTNRNVCPFSRVRLVPSSGSLSPLETVNSGRRFYHDLLVCNSNSSWNILGSIGCDERRTSFRSFASAVGTSGSENDGQALTKTTGEIRTESASNIVSKPPPVTSSSSASPPKEKSMGEKFLRVIVKLAKGVWRIIIKTPGVLWFYMTNPKALKDKVNELKESAKKEAHHYYMGTKLLAADVRTARKMLQRSLQGSSLTRRERKQLMRTTTDLFRLVPMSMFVLIPFMEFALPFALKIFPNMLPSTFQDSLREEENMKRELQSRIAMAGFFQETLQNLAKEQKKRARKALETQEADVVEGEDSTAKREIEREDTAAAFLEFLEKARAGEVLPPEVIIRYSKYFQDDLTLDNLARTQLVNLCKYMSIPAYGSEPFLRFQLRHKIRSLKEDDQRILWEGIDSLTKMELREACRERGMRSVGLSKRAYKVALQQWIDLSVNKHVPIALLIMSRSFFLHDELSSVKHEADEGKSVAGIADAISALDRDVVNEVVLEVATNEETRSNPELVKMKLEVLELENERIKEEHEEREKVLARKKAEEEEAAKKKAEEEEAIRKAAEEEQAHKLILGEEETVKETAERDDLASKKMEQEVEYASQMNIAVSDKKPAGKVDVVIDKGDIPVRTDDAIGQEMKEHVADVVEVFDETPQKEGKEDVEESPVEKVSAEELEAISHLISPNAVESEREELERIKVAMLEEDREATVEGVDVENVAAEVVNAEEAEIEVTPKKVEIDVVVDVPATVLTETSEDTDARATFIIEKSDTAAAREAEAATITDFDVKADSGKETQGEEEEEEEEEEVSEEPSRSDKKLDKTMARLRSKVESMVGKIETQLSDVEEKIGDRMHFLDKDMDGVLSRDEMAQCLQLVLRRDLTFEEAMAIAADMDENDDGLFTVAELNRWLETNKIVKLAEEGRDSDVDRAIEKASDAKEEDESQAVTPSQEIRGSRTTD